MLPIRLRLLIGAAFALICGNYSAAQSKTTIYTYDALGRLTYVQDTQNGNRDYDYDNAGNRLRVAAGTASDGAAEPAAASPPYVPGLDPMVRVIPAKPSGLFKNFIIDCAWRSSWVLSEGATYYTYKTLAGRSSNVYPTNSSGGTTVQVLGNTITVTASCPYGESQAYEPGSVKACNVDGCSDPASF
jgi:YD repeat-containing protein